MLSSQKSYNSRPDKIHWKPEYKNESIILAELEEITFKNTNDILNHDTLLNNDDFYSSSYIDSGFSLSNYESDTDYNTPKVELLSKNSKKNSVIKLFQKLLNSKSGKLPITAFELLIFNSKNGLKEKSKLDLFSNLYEQLLQLKTNSVVDSAESVDQLKDLIERLENTSFKALTKKKFQLTFCVLNFLHKVSKSENALARNGRIIKFATSASNNHRNPGFNCLNTSSSEANEFNILESADSGIFSLDLNSQSNSLENQYLPEENYILENSLSKASISETPNQKKTFTNKKITQKLPNYKQNVVFKPLIPPNLLKLEKFSTKCSSKSKFIKNKSTVNSNKHQNTKNGNIKLCWDTSGIPNIKKASITLKNFTLLSENSENSSFF